MVLHCVGHSEEVLSGVGVNQLHVMVADVIKSFDTVDRSILDCALGRLGLPDSFRKVYFSFQSQVLFKQGKQASLKQGRFSPRFPTLAAQSAVR